MQTEALEVDVERSVDRSVHSNKSSMCVTVPNSPQGDSRQDTAVKDFHDELDPGPLQEKYDEKNMDMREYLKERKRMRHGGHSDRKIATPNTEHSRQGTFDQMETEDKIKIRDRIETSPVVVDDRHRSADYRSSDCAEINKSYNKEETYHGHHSAGEHHGAVSSSQNYHPTLLHQEQGVPPWDINHNTVSKKRPTQIHINPYYWEKKAREEDNSMSSSWKSAPEVVIHGIPKDVRNFLTYIAALSKMP